MWTESLPDPFGPFSHHQWGVLLSGFVGAVLSGVVAVFVLIVSLWIQRRSLLEQMDRQAASQKEQLDATAKALEKQLLAQASEASKERELVARAALIGIVQELLLHAGDMRRCSELGKEFDNGIERWRFELSGVDEPLWDELGKWRSAFALLSVGMLPGGRPGQIEWREAKQRTGAAAAHMMNALVQFRRTENGAEWTAEQTARVLRNFRLSYLRSPSEDQVPDAVGPSA